MTAFAAGTVPAYKVGFEFVKLSGHDVPHKAFSGKDCLPSRCSVYARRFMGVSGGVGVRTAECVTAVLWENTANRCSNVWRGSHPPSEFVRLGLSPHSQETH
jgi:hypothetical protein